MEMVRKAVTYGEASLLCDSTHKGWNSHCTSAEPSLIFLLHPGPAEPCRTGTQWPGHDRDAGAWSCRMSPASEWWLLPVDGHHGRSQLVLDKDRHGHHEATLMEAGGQEGAVLGTAALVHAELVVVPGAVPRRHEDVHQWSLCVLRVPPACKTNPHVGSERGKEAIRASAVPSKGSLL